ncbi:exocyst complex component 3-like protein 4 [Conger conger]|uniref:exocyst complex component 3-like protein 4 n=1 Tax=Conger conger TaxID=82655 RepID=UPI002A5A19D4|nr:exocyst complex component 3-like protein 4 [Conger conger]XP_061114276.1 exocyst complex component 3-like protein 4 [Conger conger]XP_061114285.1 exocyst complex component 3-like protein 4 [Conger conger]
MAEKGQGDVEGGESKGPEGEGTTPNLEKGKNGIAQPDSPMKKEKKPGVMKVLRESIRRVGEKNPLASNIRGSREKLGPDSGMEGNTTEIGARSPASQSLSPGSQIVSPGKPTGRFSFRIGGKMDKAPKPDQLQPVAETLRAEKQESVKVMEVEEEYRLPEIPFAPLSVMQINKLIEMEVLEEAHLNLLSLREELKRDREGGGEDLSSMEHAKKEKDLNLLYSALREKVTDIVRDSNKLPSRNKELLVHVARIIQEEEKREGDPDSVVKGWRDIWRAAVQEGVQANIGRVYLDSREQNKSWLAVHLGLLGKAIVEDLENVKNELQGSYPPSFKVFPTYVGCYHRAVGQHLKKIMQQNLDSKDCYHVLDWMINRYESEKIMGSPTLQPEMKADGKTLSFEDGFLDQIKETYSNRVQTDLRNCLEKSIRLQSDEIWSVGKSPEIEEDFYQSEMHMDIMTVIKSYVKNSCRIDTGLEKRVVHACSTELKEFPQRFEGEFKQWSDTATDLSLKSAYQVTYINSFTILREQMEVYRESCPLQVEALGKEMKAVVDRLGQSLLEQFQTDMRPYLRRMMTRKWLSTDEDFQQIVKITNHLSQHCRLMKPPYVQEFVNKVHYHVVKEYVSQLMKNNYSCKNRKHEKAAAKMKEQWAGLQDIFEEMNSTSDWLHPVGKHLCDIIGEKNSKEIKDNLADLVKDYPDFSKKHLSAVLYFRGMVRGRERQAVLRRLGELKHAAGHPGDKSRALFSDIQVAVNTDCLANAPLFCLSHSSIGS